MAVETIPRPFEYIPIVNVGRGVVQAQRFMRCHHSSISIAAGFLMELRTITPHGRFVPTGCPDCFVNEHKPVGLLHNCDYLLLDRDRDLFMVCGYCGYEDEMPKGYAERAMKLLLDKSAH
jgi:hypothetical protein